MIVRMQPGSMVHTASNLKSCWYWRVKYLKRRIRPLLSLCKLGSRRESIEHEYPKAAVLSCGHQVMTLGDMTSVIKGIDQLISSYTPDVTRFI